MKGSQVSSIQIQSEISLSVKLFKFFIVYWKFFKYLTLSEKSDEGWMTYAWRVSNCFELSDFSAISKYRFKYLIFLWGSKKK